jgi:flagellin-like hook-associated protein FlgL
VSVLPATTTSFASELLSTVDSTQASIQHLSQELATGTSILAPSDNPAGAVQTLSAQAAQAVTNGYVTSAADGVSRLGLFTSTMNSVIDQISQVQQAVLSVSTAQTSPVGMAALATKVKSIATSLLTEANTTYEGYAIFGGTSGARQAYDAAGNYAGNGVVATRTVASGTQLPVGVPGTAVFGSGATGLFGVLSQTVADLSAGNTSAVLNSDLAAINASYATAESSAATLGAQYDQMSAAGTAAGLASQTLGDQVSSLSSTNLAKVATALQLRQSSLQAALWATSQVSSVTSSILQYLP